MDNFYFNFKLQTVLSLGLCITLWLILMRDGMDERQGCRNSDGIRTILLPFRGLQDLKPFWKHQVENKLKLKTCTFTTLVKMYDS